MIYKSAMGMNYLGLSCIYQFSRVFWLLLKHSGHWRKVKVSFFVNLFFNCVPQISQTDLTTWFALSLAFTVISIYSYILYIFFIYSSQIIGFFAEFRFFLFLRTLFYLLKKINYKYNFKYNGIWTTCKVFSNKHGYK